MDDSKAAQALSIRLWLACLATQETLCNYLGIRLGLYDALAELGPATPEQLASRAGVAPRYAREWLEQQAVSGILKVAAAASGERRFFLTDAHRQVLTDSDSPLSRVAGILPVGAVAHALPELLDAYRQGKGLEDAEYGPDWRSGHGSSNRALYIHSLPGWIRAALPDIHARLSRPGAAAADIACGAGWASTALAKAYAGLRVDGMDCDARLIADAGRNAQEAGLGDRVAFHVRDCIEDGIAGSYDLVCLFDTLHEIPRPVELLRNCLGATAEGGCVLLMDAKVADEFIAPANEVERFQYTTSVLHCLPACMARQPSAATGTVMRLSLVRAFAREAGCSRVEVLPIDDRFHRFYRVNP
jgi:2-polyprenyl-3-methyl-5-hydroxy-6-metoxy-1,4-benzoquinol methylase